jgi:hypothetical protein
MLTSGRPFDSVDHSWSMRFIEHRVADDRLPRLIRQWLKAGVLQDGELLPTDRGMPQEAVISTLLAIIYLNYVYDLWVERWRHREAFGRVIVVRYVDDTVVSSQHEADAKRFLAQLREQRCGEAHGLLEYVHYARASDQERGHQELARAFALENRVCETRHVARRSGNPIGHDDYRVCSGIGLVR